jgi:hypothetical protein
MRPLLIHSTQAINMVRIPLISFLLPVDRLDLAHQPVIEINADIKPGCFVVRIEDHVMVPVLNPGALAVFSTERAEATAGIYAIGPKAETPIIRKVIRSGGQNEGSGGPPGKPASVRVRKSFMTPTPLHIPGSRVSPIHDSTHHMLFLQAFNGENPVQLVRSSDIQWMYPLVKIVDPDHGREK